jgi:hypothetical protein
MRDHLIFEQLHKIFSSDFKLVNEELEAISGLFKNIPLNETSKRNFLEKSFKRKSAYYACLVNPNIDTLLIPEYLETKLSRNILIKKETEQYFKSIDNFRLHTIQNSASIYECILFNEDAEQNNSFDLFSNQAPESASCPEDLKLVFEQWAEDFKAYSPLETILYSILDWHAFNKYSFSNKRQMLLYLNFQLWKQFGNIFQKLDLESSLFHNWSIETLDPIKAIKSIIFAIQEDIVAMKLELRELYNEQINFKRLNSKQKIVSNFVFNKNFKLNLNIDGGSIANNSIIKQIQKKGFVDFFELSQHTDLQQQKKALSVLIESDILELCQLEGVVGLYLNTSFNNKNNYLYKFQNIRLNENVSRIDDFFNQSISNPIVPIEKLIVTPEPVLEVTAKRQKAFFG